MTKVEKAARILRSTPGIVGYGVMRRYGISRWSIADAAIREGITIHPVVNLGYRIAP